MGIERRLGVACVALGLAVALAAQVDRPEQRPLYDGVVVTEPYQWLDPPPFNAGGAAPASESIKVTGGQSPVVAVGTGEEPPQAQVVASGGALVMPAGATSLEVTIAPVPATLAPAAGYIDGNVYRFTLVDQAGGEITATESALVTIVLRSAQPLLTEATIQRLDGSAWVPLPTESGGQGIFMTTVTRFGDFAVVVQGDDPYATPVAAATPAATTAVVPTAPGASGASVEPTQRASDAGSGGSGGGIPTWALVVVVIGAVLVVGGLISRRSAAIERQDRR